MAFSRLFHSRLGFCMLQPALVPYMCPDRLESKRRLSEGAFIAILRTAAGRLRARAGDDGDGLAVDAQLCSVPPHWRRRASSAWG